jgi:hypothetical protein
METKIVQPSGMPDINANDTLNFAIFGFIARDPKDTKKNV